MCDEHRCSRPGQEAQAVASGPYPRAHLEDGDLKKADEKNGQRRRQKRGWRGR